MDSMKMPCLEFFSQYSIMTDPKDYEEYYQNLPDNVEEMIKVVQGLLIHPAAAKLYEVKFNNKQILEEEQLRSIPQMMQALLKLNSSPLIEQRQPEEKLIGICRDHSLLLVSLLQSVGIPARMRVGFANYFDSELQNESHTVAEYYDKEKECWILIDPQVDSHQKKAHNIKIDTLNLRPEVDFFRSGRVWLMSGTKEVDPKTFGYNKKWNGLRTIRSSLVQDFTALNKIELLPWDIWGDINAKNENELKKEDRDLLNLMALATTEVTENFDDLISVFQSNPYSQDVYSKLKMMGLYGELVLADLDNLGLSSLTKLKKFQLEEKNEITKIEKHSQIKTTDSKLKSYIGDVHASHDEIVICGAKHHNLKDIDIKIPKNKMTVVTGVSGSGKSTLAFDTIYAEGRRRYMASISAYARRFVEQMDKPAVDQIYGLNPAIAIEQKTVSRNPRSTVGTITEIYDYLRILFAHIGIQHCPQCARAIESHSPAQISEQLSIMKAGLKFKILSPVIFGIPGIYINEVKQARENGNKVVRMNGEYYSLENEYTYEYAANNKIEYLDIMIDHFETLDSSGNIKQFENQVYESLESAFKIGKGMLIIAIENEEDIPIKQNIICHNCNIKFAKLSPSHFNFNGPDGACSNCGG